MNLNYEKQAVGDINNDPILLSIGAVTGEVSLRITKKIQCHPIYQQATSHFNSDKLFFYFQRCIAIEIRPYVEQLFIESRYGNIDDNGNLERKVVNVPSYGIYSLLKEILPKDEISICQRLHVGLIDRRYRDIREVGKRLIGYWNRFRNVYSFESITKKDMKIAVHFAEGIYKNKQSDIVWLPNSGIEHKNLLVYFDKSNVFGKPVPDDVIKKLDEMGIQWVAVEKGMIRGREYDYWEPSQASTQKWLRSLKSKVFDSVGKWIYCTTKKLQKEVYFWKTFYNNFNVKVLYLPNEGGTEIIAQGIAFDNMGEKGGLVVGKQRSEMLRNPLSDLAGYHTKDVVFTWNGRSAKHFGREYNYTQTLAVTGHPNDLHFLNHNDYIEKVKKLLTEKGVKFIIALFDNVFFQKLRDHYDIESFYRGFLNWVLEDNTIGVVIKPKKLKFLNMLTDLLPLLDRAKATGRCILLDNNIIQLPTDAAKIADLAVGTKVSSAVIEAVLMGCRGIHYSGSFPRWNEYYKLGYETLVFDNIDRMVDAIKRYKEDPASHQELGNWTPYLSLLDPFRDGRGGERMGTYMRWLLESFDKGKSRDEAIQYANKLYAEQWGEDKVIEMTN